MFIIADMTAKAMQAGYNEANAQAKVCQDIVLALIAKSRYSRNITVKGGVVMRSITNNSRRATLDMDLDFIKYPLQDTAIDAFIDSLSSDSTITIKRVGQIEELRQQDYHGKRVYVEISDTNATVLRSKIDFGVHKHFDLEQEEYCFDVGLDDVGVSLLINSKEQMLTEKLRSILKFGSLSTRYKYIFDIYYLSQTVDTVKLRFCLQALIYDDEGMRENSIADVVRRVKNTFGNQIYVSRLKTSKNNWLDENIEEVLNGIVVFLEQI